MPKIITCKTMPKLRIGDLITTPVTTVIGISEEGDPWVVHQYGVRDGEQVRANIEQPSHVVDRTMISSVTRRTLIGYRWKNEANGDASGIHQYDIAMERKKKEGRGRVVKVFRVRRFKPPNGNIW